MAAFWIAIILFAASGSSALAQKKYDTGATDIEIKMGNIMPYSGPASAYGVQGKTQAAYFRKINAEGGINGRKINFISYDDAYSPPKAVEQARKLVESDEVLLIFYSLGTPSNTAIQKYMNAKKVPQLFVATGATKWNDPQNYPWTMGWIPNYQNEARIYAKYILKERPNARIAVLYQNDDYGKDYLKGLKDGLGERAASMIVGEDAYDLFEATIDAHVVKMKSLNADVFVLDIDARIDHRSLTPTGPAGMNRTSTAGSQIQPDGVRRASSMKFGESSVATRSRVGDRRRLSAYQVL
jgi:branched-chain amino acid transport system substrate-binding protein